MRRPKNPLLKHHLVVLDAGNTETLAALSQACSDVLGRAVSRSGVLRALVRLSPRQPVALVAEVVAEEMNRGILWGAKKRARPPS
jgi:hypothetical protein